MRRALAVTTAVAAFGLSACGGDGSSTDDGSARDRAQEGALKFAECMRENGVDMPDPQVGEDGGIRITREAGPGSGESMDGPGPKARAAEQKCGRHLRDGMPEPTPERRAEMRDAGVRYAECMRGEGIDMPDPQADGGMVFRYRRGEPGGVNPESPKFKAAHETCEEHLAKVRPGAAEESP